MIIILNLFEQRTSANGDLLDLLFFMVLLKICAHLLNKKKGKIEKSKRGFLVVDLF